MQKLLSIPENLVHSFHKVTGRQPGEWFAISDPSGTKVGSGGGSAWLLAQHMQQSGATLSFGDYLQSGKRIIIHAGGQSRRLPAYAPSGKLLAPVPVFRWSRGQRLDQTLLDLQLPLLEQIMEATGPRQHVMIAAGDVLIQSPEVPFSIPEADVVCFGIWVEPHLASHHGVFFTPRNNPHQLDFMLQKPDHETIEKLASSHLYMMDVGIWVLSDKAVELLMKKCGWTGSDFSKQIPAYYDLYSAFGPCLGERPVEKDTEIGGLSAAVVPMNKGAFYHYGTSAELITSTEKIQNKIQDQRNIWHYRVKPHPSLFALNAVTDIRWNQQHQHIWIENSNIPTSWTLHSRHVLTGIPENNWALELSEGLCLDIIPVGESAFCLRPYGMDDRFTGRLTAEDTCWMGMPVMKWFRRRKISLSDAGFSGKTDIQEAQLFPVLPNLDVAEELLRWMIAEDEGPGKSVIWLSLPRLSAAEISERANLMRLFAQREAFRHTSLAKLTRNYKRSVFYQVDLKRAAMDFAHAGLPLPEQL
ncbi:MAG: bifunctional fucokinase/L-fucose-1-P-guanylyltransferase, partial [Bacteroidales bacterium]|nr:bifunctional fucokinase/L-fucose-1-P-guanylyltransferase [Bacteroidales bacterium]